MNGPKAYYYRRFEPIQIWLHITVIVSFLGLALTGLILKFSYAPWASTLAWVLGGYQTAGALHRFFALITFGYFITHLWLLARRYLERRREGRSIWRREVIFGPNSLIPRGKDFADLAQQYLWFFGLRRERPQWDRWSYFEKFDYWAVFWGVAVIGFSGLVLWFKGFFSWFLPGWILNIAFVVHSDEALLAAGFIFGIHFFNTHLRRESFPLDTTIFTGRMTEEEAKLKHPAQFDRLKREGPLSEISVEAPLSWQLRAARFFGFTALTVGLVLLVLIIWALLC